MRNIINDGVEASERKSQARLQIIQVSSSAEPRMRLEKSENSPETSLSRPQPHHRLSKNNNVSVHLPFISIETLKSERQTLIGNWKNQTQNYPRKDSRGDLFSWTAELDYEKNNVKCVYIDKSLAKIN